MKITTIVFFVIISVMQISQAQMQQLSLKSSEITVLLSPDAGGRILSVSRNNQPNFLKLGDAVEKHQELLPDANTGFLPYFGHEIWFGPQSEWWVHQTLNEPRRKMKAEWPPDPFSSLIRNQLISQSAEKIVMKSPGSPINGLEVEKTFSLVEGNPNQLDLWVKAKNIRDTDVAWDIWFNSRTFPQSRIYAPIDSSTEVRTNYWDSPDAAPLNYEINQGLLSLKLENPPAGKSQLKGKVFFQPSEGWFAAFNQQQLLIVQFPWQSVEKIHPKQGQIEFYMEYSPTNDKLGILEMEVHSAYKKLKPGEEMQARERWTLIEYPGDGSVDAQRKFLQAQLKSLSGI